MADPTLTPDKQDDKLNPGKDPGQEQYEQQFGRFKSPSDPSQSILKNPTFRGDDPSDDRLKSYDRRENKAASGAPDNDTSRDAISNREEDMNYTGGDEPEGGERPKARLRRFANRRGITGLIALVSAITIIFSLLSGAFGLINMKESIFGKLTQRAQSVMTHAANRVKAKKFSQDLTTASCKVKIKCRYRGMSMREVKKFNRRGIAHGVRVITEPSLVPGKQKVTAIETYVPDADATIDSNTGEVKGKSIKSYKADAIKGALRKDPAVFRATNSFYKAAVQFHAGEIGRGFFKRANIYLGKQTVKDGEGKTAAERLKSQQNDLVNQAEGNSSELSDTAKKAQSDLPDEAKEGIQDEQDRLAKEAASPTGDVTTPTPDSTKYESTYGKTVNKIKNIGQSVTSSINPFNNPLSSVLNYCTIRTLVIAVNAARKIDQAIQIMRFGFIFYTLASEMESGDADGNKTAASIAAAMGILTAKDKNGKTAFDSMGYNWVTTGAVRPGLDENVGKFQNGGPPPGFLGAATAATSNGLGPVCKLANPRITAGFIGVDIISLIAGLFTFGTGTVAVQAAKEGGIQGLKIFAKDFAKDLTKKIIEEGVPKTIKRKVAAKVEGTSNKSLVWKAISNKASRLGVTVAFFYYAIPPLIEALGRAGSNTVAKGLTDGGPDAGNAAVSAAGAEVSKVSAAQGLEPITADEAVRQDPTAADGGLKQAQLEGINQFDLSNSYSFSNKLASVLMPSVAQFSTASSVPTGISSLFANAFGSLSQRAYADSTQKLQYEYCKDNDYQSAAIPVATDVFCNPQYGMDLSVVDGEDYDPDKVVDYMYDNDLIDESGKPAGDLITFRDNCMEPQALIGQDEDGKVRDECVQRDTKHRNMRLYCIHASIDSDMSDGENSSCSSEDATSSAASAASADADSQPVSEDSKVLAQNLLDSSNVTYPYTDTTGMKVDEVLKEVAKTGKGIVNSPDVSFKRVPVSPNLLKTLVEYSKDHKIGLNALTNADHASTSNHYKGIAIDIACVPALDQAAFEAIASKYGGKNNGEVCPGDKHWHYDFPKGSGT